MMAKLSLSDMEQPLKFTASSLISAVVDLSLFWFIRHAVNLPDPYPVFIATVIARLAAGGLNFALNRRWSFTATSQVSYGRKRDQIWRYTVLFVAKMVASALIVQGFSSRPLPLEVIKASVDMALFFASYFIQRDWVYAKR